MQLYSCMYILNYLVTCLPQRMKQRCMQAKSILLRGLAWLGLPPRLDVHGWVRVRDESTIYVYTHIHIFKCNIYGHTTLRNSTRVTIQMYGYT